MRFSKWHAHGNSYLLVERADARGPLDAERVRRLCDVRFGVGSDGLLEVVATADGEAEIVIWNPDGSVAEFSGNGSRIAALWLAESAQRDDVSIATAGRTYAARRTSPTTLEMAIGVVQVAETFTLDVGEERVELTPVSVGNPHAVVRREPDLDALRRLGPLLETHDRFPDRTNVQFVRVDDPHAVTAVVWERGAGETSASGSSAVAVAAAAVLGGWCESPVTVRMPGGELTVAIDGENRATLAGPAERICTGETAF